MGRSAARTRAGWAFWILIGVNAVMLWFFIGMSASLSVHAKVLDQETLQLCTSRALVERGVYAYSATFDDVRFTGDATLRFVSEFDDVDIDGVRTTDVFEIECTVELFEGDNDQLLVERAVVVE